MLLRIADFLVLIPQLIRRGQPGSPRLAGLIAWVYVGRKKNRRIAGWHVRNLLMHGIDYHQHLFRSGLRARRFYRNILETRTFPNAGNFSHRQPFRKDPVRAVGEEHFPVFNLLSRGDEIDPRAAGAKALQYAVNVILLRFDTRGEAGVRHG